MHLKKYGIICYSEKFQCFRVKVCRFVTHSNLRDMYRKATLACLASFQYVFGHMNVPVTSHKIKV